MSCEFCGSAYDDGYAAGVTAGVAEGVKSGREGALADAREAVAALQTFWGGVNVNRAEALDAIDALRGDTNG